MFERRLKIILVVLAVAMLVLFGRAFTVQVVHGSAYARAEHALSTRPPELTATTRGRILDARGTALAVDAACTDACVDYRAIVDPPDDKWVEGVARDRLKARYGADWRRQFPVDRRRDMLVDAKRGVVADVAVMWATLADLYQPTDPAAAAAVAADRPAAMDDVRRSVIGRVEMRRRLLWTKAYRRSRDRSAHAGGLLAWLGLAASPAAAVGDEEGVPDDAFQITTAEQNASHVVLRAVDAGGCAILGKAMDRFPGLSLRPSVHRSYPLRDVACHLLGRVGGPSVDELRRTEGDDPRTRYEATDDVGVEGVEALCEPLLRGVRGRVDREPGGPDAAVVDHLDYVPGQDVRLSVDADLQGRAQGLLRHVVEYGQVTAADGRRVDRQLITPADGVSMHGAIVVLDVRTNAVLALASNPTFDVNDLESRFAALAADDVNDPLDDRATSDAVEPGSTVKPMLGLGGVTAGAIGPLEGIECTGYLYLPAIAPDGTRTTRLVKQSGGFRCWTLSDYADLIRQQHLAVDHHRYGKSPHRGHDGNPDGWLTFADAIERSCDVYFETLADRMGDAAVADWYDRWGLGRPTRIGIHEVPGLREGEPAAERRRTTTTRLNNCWAGMGQGTMLATPLQVANAAAAIARGGVWMRPRLLSDDTQAALDRVRPPPATAAADAVDLHLSADALAQARIGMRAVVADDGGTGPLPKDWVHPDWLTVAAKTGTADVPLFSHLVKSPDGRLSRERLPPVVRGGPEGQTPWMRSEKGQTAVHAWYMGYAPADDPQVAFAVLIEYAGIGGGPAAGPVAAGVLDACRADGYLRPPGPATRP